MLALGAIRVESTVQPYLFYWIELFIIMVYTCFYALCNDIRCLSHCAPFFFSPVFSFVLLFGGGGSFTE